MMSGRVGHLMYGRITLMIRKKPEHFTGTKQNQQQPQTQRIFQAGPVIIQHQHPQAVQPTAASLRLIPTVM